MKEVCIAIVLLEVFSSKGIIQKQYIANFASVIIILC